MNLEPALTLSEPLGGHLVSGHVDGVGEVVAIEPDARSTRMTLRLPGALAALCGPQGLAVRGRGQPHGQRRQWRPRERECRAAHAPEHYHGRLRNRNGREHRSRSHSPVPGAPAGGPAAERARAWPERSSVTSRRSSATSKTSSPTSATAGWSSSSTTRTARTRATCIMAAAEGAAGGRQLHGPLSGAGSSASP